MAKEKHSHNDPMKPWLVYGAEFDKFDIPIIKTATDIPTSLLPFSHCKKETNFSTWIHFYETDSKFEPLWNNPKKYEHLLKRFGGIISPDFSICPDDPQPIQNFNKYRNHALAYWLSTKGIPVIPNVRWGNNQNYDCCFSGIEKHSVVSIGTHGQLKSCGNRKLFVEGLAMMVSALSPHTILVYGKAPDDIFGQYSAAGIQIIRFPSTTEQYHKRERSAA